MFVMLRHARKSELVQSIDAPSALIVAEAEAENQVNRVTDRKNTRLLYIKAASWKRNWNPIISGS